MSVNDLLKHCLYFNILGTHFEILVHILKHLKLN